LRPHTAGVDASFTRFTFGAREKLPTFALQK